MKKYKKKVEGAYRLTISLPQEHNGILTVEPVRDSRGALCGHKFRYNEGRKAFRTEGFLEGSEEDKAPEVLSKCLLSVKNAKSLAEKGLKYCTSCRGVGTVVGDPPKSCNICHGTGVVPVDGRGDIEITYKE